jgi:hypothetical protein
MPNSRSQVKVKSHRALQFFTEKWRRIYFLIYLLYCRQRFEDQADLAGKHVSVLSEG